MATTFDLLALPNELISVVLDQASPTDFESMLLSCRRVYDSGKPALRIHRECKKAMTYNEVEVAGSSQSYRLFMPLEILARIAKRTDIEDRNRAVALVRGLHYFYHPTSWQSGEAVAWLVEILEHMPPLLERFSHILARLHGEEARHTAPIDDLRRLEMIQLVRDITQTGLHSPGNRPDAQAVGASVVAWDIAAIFLMEGLRRLTINETIKHQLAEALNQVGGNRWLQELRSLRIEGPPSSLCWNITAWLCLPKLGALVIDVLSNSSDYLPQESKDFRTIFDENPSLTSSLEHLIILKSTLHPEKLGPTIRRLANLCTFAWCASQDHARSLSSDDDAEERNSEYIIFRDALHRTSDLLAVPSPPGGLPNSQLLWDESRRVSIAYLRASPCPLYTRMLVDALLERESTASVRLEHLVLTVHDESHLTFILSQHCVPHFKGFTHLTHLEIDDRLLSRTLVTDSVGGVHVQLRSLVDYVPPSIILVRLHLSSHFSDCRELLGDVAKRKDETPNLKRISIRDLEMIQDRQALYQVEQELKDVGVELVVETLSPDLAVCERSMCFERIDGSRGIHTAFFQL